MNNDGLYSCTATNTWIKGGGGSGTWGGITGTLSNQTDLQTALNGKVPTTRAIAGHPLSADVAIACADLSNDGDACAKNTGTATGTLAAGDDSRIVNAVPNTRTVAGKALSTNITLASTDLSDSANVVKTNAAATFGAFTYDFSGATHFKPVGGLTASKPATCSPPDVYFATDATAGQNWYFCTATNTWTQQLNSGGGGGSGTVSANSTSNVHALPVYATNAGSTTVQPDTAAFTDGAGALSVKSVTSTDTTHTGQVAVQGQTLDNAVPSNAFGFIGWSSTGITSYLFRPSTTAPAANTVWLAGAPAANIAALTFGKVTSAYIDSSIPSAISNGTAAMGTTAISSGTCATVVTVAATGVATTDTITYTPNTDPTAVTGYGPAATGSLYIWAYPTAGNVNFKVCNNTSASITPGALTLNWRVAR